MRLHQRLLAGGACSLRAAVGCDASDSRLPHRRRLRGGACCVVGMCRPLGRRPICRRGAERPRRRGGRSRRRPIPDGWNPDALAATCSFNSDGTISAREAPFLVGLGALFAVNAAGHNVPVDNVAPPRAAGTSRRRSPSEAKQFDQLVARAASGGPPTSPTATYGERIDDGQARLRRLRATSRQARAARRGQRAATASADRAHLRHAHRRAAVPAVGRHHLDLGVGRQRHRSGFAFFAHEKYVFTRRQARHHQGAGRQPSTRCACKMSTTARPYGVLTDDAHHLSAPGRVLRRGRARAQQGQRDVRRLHAGGRVPAARRPMKRCCARTRYGASASWRGARASCRCRSWPAAACASRPAPRIRCRPRSASCVGATRPAARHRQEPDGRRETVLLVHGYGSSIASTRR